MNTVLGTGNRWGRHLQKQLGEGERVCARSHRRVFCSLLLPWFAILVGPVGVPAP